MLIEGLMNRGNGALLEQVINFASQRHKLMLDNIANVDTPGYRQKDLSVEPAYGAVWEGLGVDIQYENLVVPASPAARCFAVAFYRWLSHGNSLHPNPVRLMPGGLDKIVADGFALLGAGSMQDRLPEQRTESWMKPVSAEKLVYRVNI